MKGVRFTEDVDPRLIQTLARHEMTARLLADIAADMTVCRLEGWDVFEYPRMVRAEMDGIILRAEHARNAAEKPIRCQSGPESDRD